MPCVAAHVNYGYPLLSAPIGGGGNSLVNETESHYHSLHSNMETQVSLNMKINVPGAGNVYSYAGTVGRSAVHQSLPCLPGTSSCPKDDSSWDRRTYNSSNETLSGPYEADSSSHLSDSSTTFQKMTHEGAGVSSCPLDGRTNTDGACSHPNKKDRETYPKGLPDAYSSLPPPVNPYYSLDIGKRCHSAPVSPNAIGMVKDTAVFDLSKKVTRLSCVDEVDSFNESDVPKENIGIHVPHNEQGHNEQSIINTNLTEKKLSRKEKPYGPAKLQQYGLLSSRMATFQNWPVSHLISPEKLATAGFIYTGTGDKVQCFVCGGFLFNWTGGLPLDEHLKWLPECKYAQIKRNQPDLLIEIWDHPAVMAVKDQEYPDHVIERAFRDLNAKGTECPNAGELMERVLEIDPSSCGDDPEDEEDEEDLYGCPEDEGGYQAGANAPLTVEEMLHKDCMEVDIKKEYEELKRISLIKEENKQLKEASTCMLCPNPANAVFLPCGHLAVCLECTKKRKDCARCSTLIRGIVKVYLVTK